MSRSRYADEGLNFVLAAAEEDHAELKQVRAAATTAFPAVRCCLHLSGNARVFFSRAQVPARCQI